MADIQKVYLCGLGAVGSAFASVLYKYDPQCIHIVADNDRVKRYRTDGLKINGKVLPFNYISPGEHAEIADLILIAVKHHQLGQAINALASFVGPQTIILALQNGIISEEIVGRSFGMDRLLYSFVVGTDATRTADGIGFKNVGKIVFGERYNDTYSDKVEKIKSFFDKAGISYEIPKDMMRELWWKFMVNVGINQVSAILGAPYGMFIKSAEAHQLLVMASKEVVNIAERAGIDLHEKDLDKFMQIMSGLSPEGKTSMLQDIESGRKTEVEIFSGTVIEFGKKYGIKTPVNDMLYRMIRVLEQKSDN